MSLWISEACESVAFPLEFRRSPRNPSLKGLSALGVL